MGEGRDERPLATASGSALVTPDWIVVIVVGGAGRLRGFELPLKLWESGSRSPPANVRVAASAPSPVILAFFTKLKDLGYSLALLEARQWGFEAEFSLRSPSSPYLLGTWALILVLGSWLRAFRASNPPTVYFLRLWSILRFSRCPHVHSLF